MTDTELKKLIEDCCDDIFNRLEPLANVKSRLYESLKPAINYTRCCNTLKDKQILTFQNWKKIKGIEKAFDGYYKTDEHLIKDTYVLNMYRDYVKNL